MSAADKGQHACVKFLLDSETQSRVVILKALEQAIAKRQRLVYPLLLDAIPLTAVITRFRRQYAWVQLDELASFLPEKQQRRLVKEAPEGRLPQMEARLRAAQRANDLTVTPTIPRQVRFRS